MQSQGSVSAAASTLTMCKANLACRARRESRLTNTRRGGSRLPYSKCGGAA